jgi:hypothetical protein
MVGTAYSGVGWLLVVGCWLLVVGCWLLVVGCWLLAVDCWRLAVGCYVGQHTFLYPETFYDILSTN